MYCAHTPSQYNPDLWHGLKDHLESVSELCFEYGKNIGLPLTAKFLGIIHDLGKYKPEFQGYLELSHSTGIKQQSVPHKHVGALFLLENLPDPYGELLANLILGHHNEIPALRLVDELFNFTNEKELENCTYLAKKDGIELDIDFVNEFSAYIKNKSKEEIFFCLRVLYSILVDSDHIDTSNHFNPRFKYIDKKINLDEMIDDYDIFQNKLKIRNEIDIVRNEIKDNVLKNAICPVNLFSMTATTGAGKTNCGLGFALHHAKTNSLSKIVFVQPFTSITDQTASIYQSIFKNQSTVLEHHSVVNEKENVNEFWRSKATLNWNAPLIVSTSIQLLESLFSNRPGKLKKLHRLANSVILIDEAQSLPLELLLPTLSALQCLNKYFNTSIVLCTATQPNFTKYMSQPKEIIDNCDEYFLKLERNQIIYNSSSLSLDELNNEIKNDFQSLCILNKRRTAQSVVKRLLKTEYKEEILHLSTTMTPEHRKKVLENAKYRLENNLRIILIATSCIECGVDIDFPKGYRQNCDLSSIFQAAGRVNRNGKAHKNNSILQVFDLKNDRNSDLVLYKCNKSRDYLLNEDITLPQTISKYFKELYSDNESRLDQKQIIQSSKYFDYPKVNDDYRIIQNDNISLVIDCEETREILCRFKANEITPMNLNKFLGPYCISVKPYDIKDKDQEIDLSTELIALYTGSYSDIFGFELTLKN